MKRVIMVIVTGALLAWGMELVKPLTFPTSSVVFANEAPFPPPKVEGEVPFGNGSSKSDLPQIGSPSQPPPPAPVNPPQGINPNLPPNPGPQEILSPDMARRAVATAINALRYLKPGKIWCARGIAGEKIIKAALIIRGRCVGIIEFDPLSGKLLPEGWRPMHVDGRFPLEKIKENFSNIAEQLRVLKGAEFRGPENAWAVPLACCHFIVAHLKISPDGLRILPDYPAEQEMRVYVQ